MNNYLTQNAYKNFSVREYYGKFPILNFKDGIINLSNSELMYNSEEKLNDCIIFYEEIDRCFFDFMAHNLNTDRVSTLKHNPLILK
jgi:hypothetical protein